MKKGFPDDTFLARWLKGELTDAEKSELEARPDFPMLKKIVENIEELELPSGSLEQAWQKQLARQEKDSQPQIVRLSRRKWWWYGAAAAVLLLIGLVYFFRNPTMEYITEVGKQANVSLPDRSEVVLNAKSAMQFKRSWGTQRLVQLEGEAFFDVQKGSIFTVETPNGQVEVLGTSFTVRSRDGELEVSCHTGKVRVISAGDSVELDPGEKVIKSPGIPLTPQPFDLRNALEWTKGSDLVLENASASRIFQELEIYYDIKVQYPEDLVLKRRITLPINNLDNALLIIQSTLNVETELSTDRKTLIIRKKN